MRLFGRMARWIPFALSLGALWAVPSRSQSGGSGGFEPELFGAHCGSDAARELPELQSSWIQNADTAGGSMQLRRILAGALGEETLYRIPLVFHVMHLGEPVGVGSNISDAQIQSAVTALNDQFRKKSGTSGDGAGVDTMIEFVLARRHPNGAPHSGINRINAKTFPNYASKGISSPGSNAGADEAQLKALSAWSRTSYINIWVVTEIDDNGGQVGTQGYAYAPIESALDGVVIVHSAVGTQGTAKNTTNQGKVLTHELGHVLGLYHTYHQTASCSSETQCLTQGDLVCDTPATPYATSCAFPACSGTQQVQNYMDATPQSCQNRFTQGQKDRMRSTLTGSRPGLTTSTGGTPVYTRDLALKSARLPPFVCGSGVQPSVLLTNLGSTTLTSATVRYRINGGSWESTSWSGTLPTGSDQFVTLNALPNLISGTYSLEFEATSPNGQSDLYAPNNSLTMSTTAPEAGENINVQFTLDLNGKDNTYTIAEGGSVLYYGGPFDNNMQGAVRNNLHCLPQACFTVSILDSFGDGQSMFSGSYQILNGLGSVLASGSGNWGSLKTHTICAAGAVSPTPTPSGTPTPPPFSDVVPPVITWLEPVSGTLINLASGNRVTVSVEASDNVEMDRVEFYSGTTLIGTDYSSPYQLAWNLATVADGNHALKAIAYDRFGNLAQTPVVTLVIDRIAPTGAITSPAHLSTLSGSSVTVNVSVFDGEAGVQQVEYYVDQQALPLAVVTAPPYGIAWDVSGLSQGVHTLGIKVVDAANNVFVPSTINLMVPFSGAIPGTELNRVFDGNAPGCYSRAQQEVFMGQLGCNAACPVVYDSNRDYRINHLDLIRVMGGVCHE